MSQALNRQIAEKLNTKRQKTLELIQMYSS